MVPMPVTLNDLQDNSPVAVLFKCNSSTIYAAFYKISTNIVLKFCQLAFNIDSVAPTHILACSRNLVIT